MKKWKRELIFLYVIIDEIMTRYTLKFYKLYYNFILNFTTLKNELHLLIELSNLCTNYICTNIIK